MRAFTLVEMLIVIVIIVALTTLGALGATKLRKVLRAAEHGVMMNQKINQAVERGAIRKLSQYEQVQKQRDRQMKQAMK